MKRTPLYANFYKTPRRSVRSLTINLSRLPRVPTAETPMSHWSPMVPVTTSGTRLRRESNNIRNRIFKKGSNILKNKVNKLAPFYKDTPRIKFAVKTANFYYKKGDYVSAFKKYKTIDEQITKAQAKMGASILQKVVAQTNKKRLEKFLNETHKKRLNAISKLMAKYGGFNVVRGSHGFAATNTNVLKRKPENYSSQRVLGQPPVYFTQMMQVMDKKNNRYKNITKELKNIYNHLDNSDKFKRNVPFSDDVNTLSKIHKEFTKRHSNLMNFVQLVQKNANYRNIATALARLQNFPKSQSLEAFNIIFNSIPSESISGVNKPRTNAPFSAKKLWLVKALIARSKPQRQATASHTPGTVNRTGHRGSIAQQPV